MVGSLRRFVIASMWLQGRIVSGLSVSSCRRRASFFHGFPSLDRRTFASTILLQASTVNSDNISSSATLESLPTVLLKRNRQSKSFRDGSQLVFSGSIENAPSNLRLGDLVQIEVSSSSDPKNSQTQVVGWGVYNPDSMYRVRVLSHSILASTDHKQLLSLCQPVASVDQLWKEILTSRFQEAKSLRRAMDLPSETTDTYRLVNGEGDGVSGLAVDVIGGRVAVIMSSAAWCQIQQANIVESLQQILPGFELIWKTTPSRLRQDGYNDIQEHDENASGPTDAIIATENGLLYETFPHQQGQKTSVYCDQRENRHNLAKLCEGKSVLDLCCYHGGFSLNAGRQNAATVVGVDSSQDAIDTCTRNAKLNGLDDILDFVKADIGEYMSNCDSQFDVVVLDPPKLAPSLTGLSKASRKYHSLNRDALKLVSDEGGILMTCTCSAAMTQKDGGKFFLQTVQQASLSARRRVTLLGVSGAAPCHTQSPVSFPAGNYLTAALFYVHAVEKP